MQRFKSSGMMMFLDDIDSNSSSNTASTLETLGFTVVKAATADGQQDQEADVILLYIEGNKVRFGAGTPTTSLGPPLEDEYILLETKREIETVKFISAVAGFHATIHAQIGYSR